MLAWMVYSTVVGTLLCIATVLAEQSFAVLGARKRLAWLVCMVATEILTVSAVVAPLSTTRVIADASPGADLALLTLWFAGCTICIAVLVVSAFRVAIMQRQWREDVVAGVPVRVSHDVGPAVVGLLHHGIVVPGWVCTLGTDEQRMVMSHEREHVRAGDPMLLWTATLLAALMPWNAALWFALHRLRHAIEMDCDARVLRTRPDARAYCTLLVDVGERTLAGAAPVVALAEPATLLERRIAAMTSSGKRAVRQVVGAAVAATVLVVAACRTPAPEVAPRARVLALVTELKDLLGRDSVVRSLSTTERNAAHEMILKGSATPAQPVTTRVEAPPEQSAARDDHTPRALLDQMFANQQRTGRDSLLARLSIAPAAAVLRYYPELAARHDSTDLDAILTYAPDGKLVAHSLRPHIRGASYSPSDFSDRDIHWFSVMSGPAPAVNMVIIVELGREVPGSSYGNFRRATISDKIPPKRMYGFRTDSLARADYPQAYHPLSGNAYVVGVIFDSNGDVVRTTARSFNEAEVFEPSAVGGTADRARSDGWAMATLFGSVLPSMTATGSQIMRDAPRTLLVFGEMASGASIGVTPSRDSLLALATDLEPGIVRDISTGIRYVVLRFDANGKVIGHGNFSIGPAVRRPSPQEIHQQFFLQSSLDGKDEARVVLLKDGNPRLMPGPLFAVVISPRP